MHYQANTFLSFGRLNQSSVIALITALVMLLAACGPSAVQESETTDVHSEDAMEQAPTVTAIAVEDPVDLQVEGYPAYPPPKPVLVPTEMSYPAETLPPPTATPGVYPPPTVEVVFAEPRFHLDLPVRVADSFVAGQAIPGMSLAVIDVTYNGVLLGSGNADSEGRFRIDVKNLVEGNRLGIIFADLEPGLSYSEMAIKYYPHRGEGFRNLPNVGVILDSTLIEP